MSGGMSVSAAQARVQRHRTPQTSTEEQTMLDLALAMSLSEATQQPEALDVSAPILSRTGADLQRRLSGSLPHANARMRQPAQQPGIDEDAALARRLQEEEDAAAATVASTAAPQPAASAPGSGPTPTAPPAADDVPPGCCAACRKPLMPSFFGLSALLQPGQIPGALTIPSLPGKAFHPKCFKCAACGKVLSAGEPAAVHEGQVFHEACLRRKTRPVCACCHEYIPADPPGSGHIRFMENRWWKERYCPAHRDSAAVVSCTSCFRLRLPGSNSIAALPDGRHTCLDCLALLVRNTADAQPLYQNVLAWYRAQGMAHREEPPFVLVEASALNDYSAAEGRGAAASAPVTHTRGICLSEHYDSVETAQLSGDASGALYWLRRPVRLQRRRRVAVTAVLVLSGMAWMLTGAVLAHELMHAWLRMEGYEHLPLQVEEGLCQLMAYLWLEAQTPAAGTIDERMAAYVGHSIRTDSSETYGDGFRQALRAFQEVGLQAILSHLRTADAFPFSRGAATNNLRQSGALSGRK